MQILKKEVFKPFGLLDDPALGAEQAIIDAGRQNKELLLLELMQQNKLEIELHGWKL